MEQDALLRSAHRWLALAVLSLALGTGVLSWAKAGRAQDGQPSSGTLVCSGQLTRSPGLDWAKSSIEFTLPYGPGVVAPLKSDIELLNGPLRIELDPAALKAAEPQPRMPLPDGNVMRIAQLQVSRQTGKFSLQAEMTRESSGLLVGAAVWEGTCAPGKEKDRKF
jgi:hypothetical protein